MLKEDPAEARLDLFLWPRLCGGILNVIIIHTIVSTLRAMNRDGVYKVGGQIGAVKRKPRVQQQIPLFHAARLTCSVSGCSHNSDHMLESDVVRQIRRILRERLSYFLLLLVAKFLGEYPLEMLAVTYAAMLVSAFFETCNQRSPDWAILMCAKITSSVASQYNSISPSNLSPTGCKTLAWSY